MSKTLDDKVTEPVGPVLQKAAPVVSPARVFRDKVYTSRTLILPDGATLPVAKGRVSAISDEQFQYLNTHPDFERLTE